MTDRVWPLDFERLDPRTLQLVRDWLVAHERDE